MLLSVGSERIPESGDEGGMTKSLLRLSECAVLVFNGAVRSDF